VTPICSGADGLGLVVLLQATWIALARERLLTRRALLLIPLGMALAFGANVVRLATLLWVGARARGACCRRPALEAWLDPVHRIALGTIAMAERIPWFRRSGDDERADLGALPAAAAAYVAPLLAGLVAALVTSIWSEGGLDRWYVARVLAAGGVLLLVRRDLPTASMTVTWFPVLAAGISCAAWIAFVPVDPIAGGRFLTALEGLGTAERWAWLATRVVGSCLLVPVVEELAFRGFLLRWLVSPEFEHVPPRAWTWWAVLLSSIAFGALHSHWILGTLAGLAFAAARLRRGRLSDAVLAHALANAGIAVAVLGFGRWDLWA
jgi:exosortase E/protease (VPEID-CTERM system)